MYAAVNGSQAVLIRQELTDFDQWLEILVAFDVVYVATGYLVFEYVVGD